MRSPGKNTGVNSQGDLPDSGIEPRSPALKADSLPYEPPGRVTFIKLGRSLASPGPQEAVLRSLACHSPLPPTASLSPFPT